MGFVAWDMLRGDGTVREGLETLASRVVAFDVNGFLSGHSPSASAPVRRWEDSKNDALFDRIVKRADVNELRALLKHPDPKVRTLVLAAMFSKEDPRLLPEIQVMTADTAETFSFYLGPSQTGAYGTPVRQTVGEVAVAMIQCYMRASGCSYGGDDKERAAAFASYWEPRKDRTTCAGWFEVQLQRATRGAMPPAPDRQPEIARVREQVDRLPPDERAWTLLWVRSGVYAQDDPGYPNMFVTNQELLEIFKKLGPDKIFLAWQGQATTADPDMGAGFQNRENARNGKRFLLRHAAGVFRPEDAEALMAQGRAEMNRKGESMRTAWWWIAAAQVQPDRAGAILREGVEAWRNEAFISEEQTGLLMIAMSEMEGEKEADFLTEWVYGPGSKKENRTYVRARQDFIDSLAAGSRSADKHLLARMLSDERAVTLEPEILAHAARAVNGWLPAPLVSWEDMGRMEGFAFKKGGGAEPQMVPGVLEKLRQSIPQWSP